MVQCMNDRVFLFAICMTSCKLWTLRQKFWFLANIWHREKRQCLSLQKWMQYQSEETIFVQQNMDSVCLHSTRNSQEHPKYEAIQQKVWNPRHISDEDLSIFCTLNLVKIVFFLRQTFQQFTYHSILGQHSCNQVSHTYLHGRVRTLANSHEISKGPRPPFRCKWNLGFDLIIAYAAHRLHPLILD